MFHIKAAKNKKHSEFTMVHHFNPGGNIPPWLINWLAEGKPITFVRKLEEVARKWDEQAALTKSMPCKGRGFGESRDNFGRCSSTWGVVTDSGYALKGNDIEAGAVPERSALQLAIHVPGLVCAMHDTIVSCVPSAVARYS